MKQISNETGRRLDFEKGRQDGEKDGRVNQESVKTG